MMVNEEPVNFLYKNLAYLLTVLNMDASTLAEKTQIPLPTISRMRKKGANLTISSLQPIAQFFGVTIDTLLYMDMESAAYKAQHEAGKIVYVSVIGLSDVLDWPHPQKIEGYIGITGLGADAKAFGIRIDSDRLHPVFKQGSTLIINTQKKPEEGNYVLVSIHQEHAPVIRQLFIDGNHYYFKPLNAQQGMMNEPRHYKIIGTVVRAIEDFK